MADISKLTMPSGVVYNIKDAAAREDIAVIQSAISGRIIFRGETSTPLANGDTNYEIIINSDQYIAMQGDLVVYSNKEFVFDGTQWIELGDLSLIGDLGWKDSASATYRPAGSVSKPNVIVTPTTDTVYSITDVGNLPTLITTVNGENLMITFNQGSLPTKGVAQTVMASATAALETAPTFSGTEATITVT